jgi:two-component system NtrC family sensor kinase
MVIIIGGTLSLVIGSRLVKNTIISQAQEKVQHDLDAAWMVFNEKLNDIKDVVNSTTARESIRDAMKNNQSDILLRYLTRVKEQFELDVLTLTDRDGRVIVRTRNPATIGDDQRHDEIVSNAIKNGICASPQIISREELLKEGKDLTEKAYIEFIETPKAAPRSERFEEQGMMLKAASSVMDEDNTLLGVLYGGILLNRNFEIVDRVKEIVYKHVKYKEREIGTATIFQHDLRISTNVRNESGERAIGTRVSTEVNQAVLQEGRSWIDRAFVVNDWYITAYEPIKNIRDDIIGILYVGMLERPYIDTTNKVIFTFAVIAVLCVAFLLGMLYISTSRIINPLQKMVLATQKIAKGDLSHTIEVKTQDEIGDLADSFNQMTADLKVANEKLIDWGKTLEKKVEERADEIKKMQASLIQSEKLASLGKLAAGIAHEINNPLGGILIYSSLLLEDTEKDSPYYPNLEKIVKETTRCKEIVKGLLEFARPKDPEMSETDVNEALESALVLLQSQAIFQNVEIKKDFAPHPSIVADKSQLQQVFINIILNAVDAMDGQGILTLKTYRDKEGRTIHVSITDTGHGINKEDIQRLFEPFFSTKEAGVGTGLGLSICYSIIQKHQGKIDVESEVGKGSTFVVTLPLEREAGDD